MMHLKCNGCGAFFQSNDPKQSGYIKSELLSEKQLLYCERCFRLKHYNIDSHLEKIEYDHQNLLKEVKKSNSLMVYVIDLYNLSNSVLTEYHKLINSLNCLVVVNKYDVLSKVIDKNKASTYIRKYLRENNLKFNDLIIISSFKNDDILQLKEKIDVLSKSENIYFFGASNVGKSSILNKLVQNNNYELTVSNLMKTTLGEIKIPYFNKYIIDTPGVIISNQYPYYLTKKTLEQITPKKAIKPKVYQLNSAQSIFINGFVQIDFLSSQNFSFISYFENNLYIHRTKLENSDQFFLLHQDDILKLPTAEEKKRMGERKKYSFNIEGKKDIVINGLGFFTVIGDVKIDVLVYDKIGVNMRDAII